MHVLDVIIGLLRSRRIQITLPITWTGYRMPPKFTYFSDEEIKGLDYELVALLDKARGLAKTPFRITSGLRTLTENEQLASSVKDSAHLGGLAVDVACQGSQERFEMLKALLDVGFTRIGIYAAHLHVDTDRSKPQNVIWYVKAA